jgi:UDP-N-acetylglucosamine 2-epimerase (non-hydrolysing)
MYNGSGSLERVNTCFVIKKIMIVFGTRPEAIKMAPLVIEFRKFPDKFNTIVCVTAQHRQMLDQVLEFFDIKPDYDLDIMKPGQDLFSLTSGILLGMKEVIEDCRPDYIFVHGDTTTSAIAALSAYYTRIKVCHIEAGLRTYDKYAPYPEEMNRQITGRITDIHFAPTDRAKQNLLNEGIFPEKIVITGNTVIDALLFTINKLKVNDDLPEISYLKSIIDERHIVLVTGHRRENFGPGFLKICDALKEITEINPNVQIIYPVHLNPNVQKPVYEKLGNISSIRLIEPISYPAFAWLIEKSRIILTDSGGIQEEAPSLGKPVLVMREETERPEAIEAGTAILVGTDRELIVKKVTELLADQKLYDRMSKLHNPYGDGSSCKRVVNTMINL